MDLNALQRALGEQTRLSDIASHVQAGRALNPFAKGEDPFAKSLNEQGAQGVANVQALQKYAQENLGYQKQQRSAQDDAELDDPNSADTQIAKAFASQIAPQAVKQLGPNFDSMTAAQLYRAMPMLKELVTQEKAKKEQDSSEARASRAAAFSTKYPTVKTDGLSIKQIDDLEKTLLAERGADRSDKHEASAAAGRWKLGKGGLLVNDATGETQRVNMGDGAAKGPDDATKLAIEGMALDINVGKAPDPGMARGKEGQAMLLAATKRAAELRNGATPLAGASGTAEARVGYEATKHSIGKQQEAVDTTEATEAGAVRALDIAMSKAAAGIPSGSPLLNEKMGAIQSGVFGNVARADYVTALSAAGIEAARVLKGGGQVTEGMRHEIETLISPNSTLQQALQSAKTLKEIMASRTGAMREHLETQKHGLGGAKPDAGASMVIMVDPKGGKHSVPASEVDEALAHKWRRAQ